jgi:hypothetical protein
MTTNALAVYLSDHLGGSVAGHDLAAKVIPDLAPEIEADQAVLETLMEQLGVRKRRWKGLRALLASFGVRHKDPHDLIALETLALGIAGKLLLWKALKEAQDSEPFLRSTDLDQLIDRATKQFDEVERERLRRASELFRSTPVVPYG